MNQSPEELPADNIGEAVAGVSLTDSSSEPPSTISGTDTHAVHSAQEDRRQTFTHMIWLAVAIIVPSLAIFFTSHEDVFAAKIFQSLRLGATSFFVALAILGLSQIDRKLLGNKLDSRAQILASMLGVMLWLVWVGSGQMVLKAVDESKEVAAIEPGL